MTVNTVETRRPIRRWVAAVAALLLAGAAAPHAATAERVAYPPGAFSLSLAISVVGPGVTVQAVAAGCTADVTVRLEVIGGGVSTTATCVASTAVQVTTSTLTGSATFSFQSPGTVGVYTVRATELGGQGRSATTSLTVAQTGVAAPTTTDADLPPTDDDGSGGGGGDGGGGSGGGSGGGTLPKSGSDTGALMATAAAALLLGGGLAIVARRRRQRPAPAA